MSRPTKERVAEIDRKFMLGRCDARDVPELVAELRALREELANLERRSLAALEQMTIQTTDEMRREELEQSEIAHLSSDNRRLRMQAAVATKRLDDECASYSDEMVAKEEEIGRMQESIDLYRATIARVEALPVQWREHAEKRWGRHGEYGDGRGTQAEACADDVEEALKGGEP